MSDTPYRLRWAALVTLLVAEAMNLLDTTIVQVAAPVIHERFGGPDSDVQWFGAAYTLPFAVLLITGGRLGDVYGRRRMFRVGVTGFVAASALCACAGSAEALIAARAFQGAAAALIIPQTFGLIRAMFHGAELPRALGCIGPVMGLSAVCGPALGGIVTHAVSWRMTFLVNVPLGLAVLLAAPLLREDRAAVRPRLDLAGTALAVAGAGLVVYSLIGGRGHAWTAGGAGAALLAAFAAHQRWKSRRGRSPLVEVSLFRDRGFPAALASSVLFFSVMIGLSPVVVLQLRTGAHADVLTAGLTLLPWSFAMGVSSWVSGAYLVPRYGSRVMFAGLATLLCGILSAAAVYATASDDAYPWPLLPALAVAGLGLGMFTAPFFSTALARVRPHETGSAAGLLNAVQQFGGTVGIALLGTVFFHAGTARAGAQHALWTAAGLIVATAVAAVFMTAPRDRRTDTLPRAGARAEERAS
ncbi:MULTISPECIES: MFS transporter [Actinomadura]|uniref:MFS transporter n=1 Tax=Actinomadura yumaensis TaxID=111807 RepID=A0ABW2CGV5_9ACTN|nr:MFS transporter [Actinomadura sp. J1-007]MWK34650.1 MFS transporter [Actinomadura sp. J1-007]